MFRLAPLASFLSVLLASAAQAAPVQIHLGDEISLPGLRLGYGGSTTPKGESYAWFNLWTESDQVQSVWGGMYPFLDKEGNPTSRFSLTFDVSGLVGGGTTITEYNQYGEVSRGGTIIGRSLSAVNNYRYFEDGRDPVWNGVNVYGGISVSPFKLLSGSMRFRDYDTEDENGRDYEAFYGNAQFQGEFLPGAVIPLPAEGIQFGHHIESVPEPSGLILLGLAVPFLARRRRARR